MRQHVRLRDETTVRVTKKKHPLEAQMLTHLLEVGDIVVEAVRPSVPGTVRAAGTSRIQDHECEALPETGQVTEIGRRQTRPARMAHQHRSMAELAVSQLPAVGGREAQ